MRTSGAIGWIPCGGAKLWSAMHVWMATRMLGETAGDRFWPWFTHKIWGLSKEHMRHGDILTTNRSGQKQIPWYRWSGHLVFTIPPVGIQYWPVVIRQCSLPHMLWEIWWFLKKVDPIGFNTKMVQFWMIWVYPILGNIHDMTEDGAPWISESFQGTISAPFPTYNISEMRPWLSIGSSIHSRVPYGV